MLTLLLWVNSSIRCFRHYPASKFLATFFIKSSVSILLKKNLSFISVVVF